MDKYKIHPINIFDGDTFKEDRLNRQPLVNDLSKLIGRLPGPFVLALDSPFGTGKTTFVNMLIPELNQNKHHCIYFNAWKNDYAIDPLIALVASIKKGILKERIDFKDIEDLTTKVVMRVAVLGVRKLTNIDFGEEIERLKDKNSNMVDQFIEQQVDLEKFRQVFEQLVRDIVKNKSKQQESSQNTRKLIIFIDELDRCKPTFAIKLLERIKHFFDIPNVIFVLSIDRQQLEECIKVHYGAGTNATEYLRRFIDLDFSIPDKRSENNIIILLSRLGLWEYYLMNNDFGEKFVTYFNVTSEIAGLTIRAQEKSIARLGFVFDKLYQKKDPELLALLIILKTNSPEKFTLFINGNLTPEEAFPKFFENYTTNFLRHRPKLFPIFAWLYVAFNSKDYTDLANGDEHIKQKFDILFRGYREMTANNPVKYIKDMVSSMDFVSDYN